MMSGGISGARSLRLAEETITREPPSAVRRLLAVGVQYRRGLLLFAVVALVAAACGGSTQTSIDLGGPTTEEPATQPATTQPATTEAPTSGTSSTEAPSTQTPNTEAPATTQAPRQRPDGPDASDFELALGGPGGTFSLSAEDRPVFMVFWAEW